MLGASTRLWLRHWRCVMPTNRSLAAIDGDTSPSSTFIDKPTLTHRPMALRRSAK
uniref:Uncharacterized protein n=1 Tax=Plectus sambesii TaxID=2011161 RepID=A0A914VDV5_9BILA